MSRNAVLATSPGQCCYQIASTPRDSLQTLDASDREFLRSFIAMPKDFPRALRVAEQLRREIAELLRSQVKDPRVGMVTISDVEVSRDLKHAKVYFTVLGDHELMESSQIGLDNAVGFLRHELGRRLQFRAVPELRFIYDHSLLQGERVSALIDEALSETRAQTSEREE